MRLFHHSMLFVVCCLSTIAIDYLVRSSPDTAITTADKPYLIKQGTNEDGSIYLYSPYFLWNDEIYGNSSALQSPLALRAVNGKLDLTLTVEASFVQTDVFDFNTRTYCFSGLCNIPGPTLYLSPGDELTITLQNNLQNSSGISQEGALEGQHIFPNRTNIFIQGLPLDPAINNPYRFTWGDGDSLTYNYVIAPDTPLGLHWYHSRVHGIASLQVMGGLFGALVIQEPEGASTSLLPAALQAVDRQLLVLSHVMVAPDDLIISGVRGETFSLVDEGLGNSSLSLSYLTRAFGSNIPLDITLVPIDNNGTTITDAWFTNGMFQPTYSIKPGEWRIFDILVASGDRIIELELRTELGFGAGDLACEVRLLALDGLYLYPESRMGDSVRHLTLLQSGRASIAVMCSSEGTYYLQSATTFEPISSSDSSGSSSSSGSSYAEIGDYQTKSSQNLLVLDVFGEYFVMDEPPTDLTSIPRPDYLQQLVLPSTYSSSSSTTTTTSSATSTAAASTNDFTVVDSSAQVAEWSVSTAQGGCCGEHSLSNHSRRHCRAHPMQ